MSFLHFAILTLCTLTLKIVGDIWLILINRIWCDTDTQTIQILYSYYKPIPILNFKSFQTTSKIRKIRNIFILPNLKKWPTCRYWKQILNKELQIRSLTDELLINFIISDLRHIKGNSINQNCCNCLGLIKYLKVLHIMVHITDYKLWKKISTS